MISFNCLFRKICGSKPKVSGSEVPVILLKVVHNGLIREWVCNSSENQTVVGNFLFSAVSWLRFGGEGVIAGIKH